jgi:predicted ribosomally synthesized peptide with SipW-like signal peptide
MKLHKLLVSALILGALGLVAGAATWSAFSSNTDNPGNTFEAGTVSLADNDGGGTLLSLTNANPGATTSGCIQVTYGGNLDADVRLFGSVSGTLAQYLTLKVTRGSNTGAFPNCSFTADTRDYIGQGAGVIYNGNLSAFPASYAAGVVDPDNSTGGPETWSNGEGHAYKLEVTLQNNTAAQGQSATASFTWEARNQ